MLKITTNKTGKRYRLVLEGELVCPWVTELRREWDSARASAGDLSLTVDLRSVTTISQTGKILLRDMMSEGVDFVCGGVLNRYVLQQLIRKAAM